MRLRGAGKRLLREGDAMEFATAEMRAADLLKQAERYRGLAADAAEHDTANRLRRLAQDLESEAAIEMAHAALLRNRGRSDAAAGETSIAEADRKEKA
jgi:hypothetical protein